MKALGSFIALGLTIMFIAMGIVCAVRINDPALQFLAVTVAALIVAAALVARGVMAHGAAQGGQVERAQEVHYHDNRTLVIQQQPGQGQKPTQRQIKAAHN